MKNSQKHLGAIGLALALVGVFALGYDASAARAGSEHAQPAIPASTEEASCERMQDCKPAGAACTNSFECCSQNCQTVNGSSTCH